MEQTKALNALEPFLALSKSAISPRAAADLVERATAAPNTYVFAELLQTPQIQALASSPEYAPHLSLLRIFSHGDYAAYESTPNLPPLDDAQRLKLRQLSLLSLAASSPSSPSAPRVNSTTTTTTTTATTTGQDNGGDGDDNGRHANRSNTNLSYDRLCASLRLDSVRQLETLVTTAIYAGLIDARLDPARQRVQITRVAPLRDLAPGDVADMRHALRAWSARCTAALRDVENHITRVHAAARARTKAEAETSFRLSKAVAQTEKRELERNAGGGGGGDGAGGRGREYYTRRSVAMKRSIFDAAAKGPAEEEFMDLDFPAVGEDSVKRAGKRKM